MNCSINKREHYVSGHVINIQKSMHFYIPARENANFTKIPFKVYVATRTMKVHRNKLNKILCILM